MALAYDELVDFIVRHGSPGDVVAFRLSEPTREQVWELIRRQKEQELNADETAELDTYMQLEHIMRLAKARARLKLSQ